MWDSFIHNMEIRAHCALFVPSNKLVLHGLIWHLQGPDQPLQEDGRAATQAPAGTAQSFHG